MTNQPPPLPADIADIRKTMAGPYPREDIDLFAVDRVLDALEAATKDAARWQWLSQRLLAADFNYNDEGLNALVFEMPADFVVSADANETIDAAMKEQA